MSVKTCIAQFIKPKLWKVLFLHSNKANFKVKKIDAEGDFATIKTTRQTGGYDIRSFKFHLVPEQTIPDLKVGMSVLFNIAEAK